MRSLLGQDISTGQLKVSEDYSTQGPSSTFHIKNDIPEQPPNRCYILDMFRTCSEEEISWLKEGTAVVKDYVVIGREAWRELEHDVLQKVLVRE